VRSERESLREEKERAMETKKKNARDGRGDVETCSEEII
jgi:hypothetical protein